jgi:flagellar M-ring protein FliF
VVAAVLGIVPERGDQLVIESLPFEETLEVENGQPGSGQPDSTSAPPAPLWADRRVLIGAGAGLVLLLGAAFFLLRRRKPAAPAPQIPAALSTGPTKEELQQAKEQEAARAIEEASRALDEKIKAQLPAASQSIEVLRMRVREHVEKDPKLVASVLRSWLDEPAARLGVSSGK